MFDASGPCSSDAMPRKFTPDQHRLRAIVGIGAGLLFAAVAAAGPYVVQIPDVKQYWAALVIPSLLLSVWGVSHMARQKGYPGGAAYGLFAFALAVAAVAGLAKSPLDAGSIFIFVDILPVVVVFTLPRKPTYLRRW